MKRTLAALAAAALIASVGSPILAADTQTPSGGTAATTSSAPSSTTAVPSSSAPASETGANPATTPQKQAKTTHHHHHRSRKHRMLHHARSMDKGTAGSSESASPGASTAPANPQ
jgi:hypothetical protein